MSRTQESNATRGARRREQTRSAILDAAEHLMSTQPADAVRIEDVANVSGISVASIYGHFGTKDGLVGAAIERLLQDSRVSFTAAYSAPGRPFERMAGVGQAYLQLLLGRPALAVHVTLSGLQEPSNDIERRVSEHIDELRRQFEDCIQAGIDEGQMRPIDARAFSYFLFGAWNGVAALALRRDKVALSSEEVVSVIEVASAVMDSALLIDQ